METIKLSIGFREWSKLGDFVETMNGEDDIFAYQIDGTTAIVVTLGPCATHWVETQVARWFNDWFTNKIK